VVPRFEREVELAAQDIPLRVVFEDEHLLVLDKPPGLVVHPAAGHEDGTLVNALLAHCHDLRGIGGELRPGIVHRIDKDTSGLVCFAKTKLAERGLHKIFKEHLAEREYAAVAQGQVQTGRIESQLIENRGDGLRGSFKGFGQGQRAVTDVEVVENLRGATLCRVRLKTGRTHQIRIHLSERGNPLVGETVYIRDLLRRGGRPIPSDRLLLHAATLGFDHPITGERLHFAAPLPPEFTSVVDKLRR